MNKLDAISPIDGRYRRRTEPLAEFFSEKALIKHRITIEGEYLIFLSEHPQIGVRDFSEQELDLIRGLYELLTEDAGIVKAIEFKGYKDLKATNHDVKAVEYFMKERLCSTSLRDSLEWIHFALTSEDTNNLAYGLMLSGGIGEVVLPAIEELYGKIDDFAQKYKNVPMLARTHGQPASPTTVGKEFNFFATRLKRQLDQLKNHEILVKLNGATGNYNAHCVAYPQIDWLNFTKDFVQRLNDLIESGFANPLRAVGERRMIRLKPNFVTTQIEPHDSYAELFDIFRRLNVILVDFNQDVWRYISDEWFKQKTVDGEVGSSTMPHKINPIDFENSEGNLGVANALFGYFTTKLPISRLQRDLSDSTVKRNFGVALGHCLVGYRSALKGLSKLAVNETKIVEELEDHPEIISEAIQTVLRREGTRMPYEQLKALTRGSKVTMRELSQFIDGLDVSDDVKAKLREITPTGYTGIA